LNFSGNIIRNLKNGQGLTAEKALTGYTKIPAIIFPAEIWAEGLSSEKAGYVLY